jgi:hypothetical protein
MKKTLCLVITILCGELQAQQNQQQQMLLGATTNLPGATLVFSLFINGTNYTTDSGYCFSTVSGSFYDYNIAPGQDANSYSYPYAGYYYNCLQIFNALPATEDNGGPADGAAALGTVIGLKLLAIEGPAGASFAFWEGDSNGSFGTNLTWSVPVPSSEGTNRILVTQAPNSPTNDPYGYIKNRVFGFTKPGLYKLTWQLVDTSTNGPGGTPLNLPSPPFTLNYQADCTINSITRQADGIHLGFVVPSGCLLAEAFFNTMQYNIEQSSSLGEDADWQTVLDSQGHTLIIFGDDHLHTNIVAPTSSTQFYRLFGMPTPQYP